MGAAKLRSCLHLHLEIMPLQFIGFIATYVYPEKHAVHLFLTRMCLKVSLSICQQTTKRAALLVVVVV